MRSLGRAPLVPAALLLLLLLLLHRLVAVASASDGPPGQDDSGELNPISISASEFGSEIELHCTFHGVSVETYNVSFKEVGFVIDPDHQQVTIHHHGNGSFLEAWLTLPFDQPDAFGRYFCCLESNQESLHATESLECSDPIDVLPSSGNVSIVTHKLNHGDLFNLFTLGCSEEQWLEINLQDGLLTYRNSSLTADAIITLTHLWQQAKFICLGDASTNSTAVGDTVEQIVYLLADYEPIHFISPAVNNTIPPPQPPGHRFQYDCTATARPMPNVYWYDDWYPYNRYDTRRKRVSIPNGQRLIVPHLQNQLHEVYWIACVAENAWQKEYQWIKYPDPPPPPTTRPPDTTPPPSTTVTTAPSQPPQQFNVTITFSPSVCDTLTTASIVINITGVGFNELFNSIEFSHGNLSGSSDTVYGIKPSRYQIPYGFVVEFNGVWPVDADGLWEIFIKSNGNSIVGYANATFTVREDLVEFVDIPQLITANIDDTNYVFNATVSAIVHYHDAAFIQDRINFTYVNIAGGAGLIFRQLLSNSGSTVCYSLYNTTSVRCEYTLILNTLRSGASVNTNGSLQWKVEFWKSPPVYSRNVTKLSFDVNVATQPPPQGETSQLQELIAPIAVISFIIILLLVSFGILVSMLMLQKHLKTKRMQRYYESLTPVQRMLLKVKHDYEDSGLLYSMDQLQFETGQLGEGAFGVVRKAVLQISDAETVTVAVKALKGSAIESDMGDFISEFKMLVRIGSHPNIVNLVGAAVNVDEEQFYILVEFAAEGSLLSFLKRMRKEKQTMSWSKGLNFALQIAKGMMHLSSKECVHCDLAARNILITADGSLKVSDFGLARKLYYEVYHKNVTNTTRLPLKWMAIESLECHEFTTQSDVWSFGVLLWEIATLGGGPYPMVHPKDLLVKLKGMYRMSKPHGCPVNIYTIMRSCWLPQPTQRPTFSQLVAMLDMLLGDYLSVSEAASITASELVDVSSEHTGSTIEDNQCCQIGEEGMDVTGTEYTLGEGVTSTEGWYTGESASVGTLACNGIRSPFDRTAAGTPSDHTSTCNGAVCDYCSGMCQECTCENSAQMTGASKTPEYENVDVERGMIQNGNLTSVPLPSYEPHSLLAVTTSNPPGLPPVGQIDCFSSANCHNLDMCSYTTNSYYGTDGCYATDVSLYNGSVYPHGYQTENV